MGKTETDSMRETERLKNWTENRRQRATLEPEVGMEVLTQMSVRVTQTFGLGGHAQEYSGVSLPFQLELPESQAGGWGSTEGLVWGNVVEEQVNYLKDTVSRGIWVGRWLTGGWRGGHVQGQTMGTRMLTKASIHP